VTAALGFRRARIGDVPAIVALLADDAIGSVREDAAPPGRYDAAFAAIAQDANQYLAVAEQAGQIVGCLQLSFIPGLSRQGAWRGQIEGVRIASGHRGAGLGAQMLAWAIATCRDRGCDIVQLTTDKRRTDAIRFYEKLGFRPSHEGMKLTL
jgi:ribosomal protein S18 acetylase RimI-like enzyme